MADKPNQTPAADPDSFTAEVKATLFDELLEKDAEIRNSTLRSLQKLHPEKYMTEIRVMDAVNDRVKGLEDKFEKDRQDREQRDLSERLAGEKRDATKGLDDEGIKSLEKLMVDNKIGSYGAARELYNLRVKAATPTNLPHRVRGGMPANLKDISANPGKWARDQAFQAVDELAARREALERV